MKRILFASVATVAVLFAGAMSAADLPRREAVPKAPVMAPPAYYNWSGFYLGINGGATFVDANLTSPAGTTGHSFDSGLIGVTAGYNLQSGPWVWGVEGDLGYTNARGAMSTALCPGCAYRNFWLGTVRGRVGYAFNRMLPYITGGLAVGDVGVVGFGIPGNVETQVGWTLGGGVEFALAGNWTAKAEYLYVDLGSTTCSAVQCGGIPHTVDYQSHVLRAGLNYRF